MAVAEDDGRVGVWCQFCSDTPYQIVYMNGWLACKVDFLKANRTERRDPFGDGIPGVYDTDHLVGLS